MIKNKVVYVTAFFKPVGKEIIVEVPTGEKKKSLFGFGPEKDITRKETQFKKTGFSDCQIDGERLSNDVAMAIDQLNQEDYEVISVLPVISGNYYYKYQSNDIKITSHKRMFSETEAVSGAGGASYGFGYGYSYTEGVSIIARKVSF